MMSSSSPPGQLISLQHFISRLLPPSAPSDSPSRIAAALCRACQQSFTSLHDPERCKDEIWNVLRSSSVSPTPSQIDELLGMISSVHQQCTNSYKRSGVLDAYPNDNRLSEWNVSAKHFFEQMVLTSGVGTRINDPRSSANYAAASSSSNQVQSSSSARPSSSKKSGFDPTWLRNRCAQLAVCQTGQATPHEMAISVMLQLSDKSISDEYLQSYLYDCFAGDFDAVADVLQKRSLIVANQDAITADGEQAREIHEFGVSPDMSTPQRSRGVRGRTGRNQQTVHLEQFQTGGSSQLSIRNVRQENIRRENERKTKRLLKAGLRSQNADDDDDDDESDDDFVMNVQDFSGSAYEERQRAFPGVQLQSDSVIGSVERVGLPKGATREVGKGYEEIFVPPPQRKPGESQLVDVASALGEHPELLEAMRGVKTLNRLQSAVFPAAFKSDENMLVCAPTGAGKTNVALLTIFREIVSVKLREKRNFKVVYVAPMKALAAEVTEKFSHRLGPLGLTVREYTGDISPSRAETIATHVLVTTPEKWDVVTRKSGSDVGEAVTLFIIDEIHLLHDERGAVLESIVARTLRFSETAQRQIRLVGLSATLPNYADVGSFMRVNPQKGLFHFDGSHRPVPLSQTFIGISEGQNVGSNEARRRKENKVHEMAYKKIKDSLQRGHQAMIFVHSRKGTSNAAREMITRATQDRLGNMFIGGESQSSPNQGASSADATNGEYEESDSSKVIPSWAAKEISKSKTADIRELCMRGIGIHNAGLPRPDRKLVEKLFAEGILRLLCCTATLAWGVNLPARTVVIMGTEVYNAEKGGFEQLGMLDVMQIFGRAGRPQFDTEGEGTIITDHEHLSKYLNLLTSSVPIESRLSASASRLADHLNAEIVSGTVSSVGDGVRWLSYTYLSVRMPQNPLVYGIDWAEVHADSNLHSRRAQLIEQAAKALDDARMCRYDNRTGVLSPLDLGRVSSHFYVSHETILEWTEQLSAFSFGPAITVQDWKRVYTAVIHAVSCATEFEQMRSREEEAEELNQLIKNACPVPLKKGYGSDSKEGKVAILLQAHISRAVIRMSDLSYIVQSATRLLRAIFEISLRRGMPSFSVAALELARASESRIWPFQHPLWQFTYLSRRERGLLITPETIAAIESSGQSTDIASLRSRTREELSELIRAPRIVSTVEKVLKAIPTLEIMEAKVAPLSKTLLSVHVKLLANFTWNDLLHGNLESWWLWIEDKEEYRIYHSQKVMLTKRQVQDLNADVQEGQKPSDVQKQTIDMNFIVAVFDPPSAEYWVRVESDRWHTGGGATALLTVANMQLPSEISFKTDISTVLPTNVSSVFRGDEAEWFSRQSPQFNIVQSSVLYTAYNTEEPMLVCFPPDGGELTMAEMVMLRAFQRRRDAAVVVITLHEGTLELMSRRWEKFAVKFGQRSMLIMTPNTLLSESTLPHPEAIGQYAIIATTPQQWINYLHSVTDEKSVFSRVSAFIVHDLHRSMHLSNVATELFVSRLRKHRRTSTNKSELPRIVAFSAVIPNALQVSDWLGVSRKMGLFCLGEEARQIACETYLVSVAGDRYGSRMQSINRPLYSTIQRYSYKKPVLIFVSSRRQSFLTAKDLLRLASLDGKEAMFVGKANRRTSASSSSSVNGDVGDLSRYLRAFADPRLRQLVPRGIGLYHENLSVAEREAIEVLFNAGRLLAVIVTFDMAPSISMRSHSVIVKGTETFNLKRHRYEDISTADIVHMIGRAGRSGIDTTSYATIFVHEPRQTLFKKLVREPLPLESGLLDGRLDDIMLNEIVDGNISNLNDGITWLRNTFFFMRLHTNPGRYELKKGASKKREKAGVDESTFEAERRNEFCDQLLLNHLQNLERIGCVMLKKGPAPAASTSNSRKKKSMTTVVKHTRLGEICCQWRVCATSGNALLERLTKNAESMRDNHANKVGFEDLFNTLSSCDEIRELGKDYEEDAVWRRLFDRVVQHFVKCGVYSNEDVAAKQMKLNGWAESSQKRGKMLCYGTLSPRSPPTRDGTQSIAFGVGLGLGDEMQKRIDASSQILAQAVNCALDIAMTVIRNSELVRQLVRLKQCVCMRQAPSTDFWYLCPATNVQPSMHHSNLLSQPSVVDKARKEGWVDVKDIMAKEQEFSMFIARVCQETERAAIMRWVNAYPRLDVVSTSVTSDNTLQVVVKVKSNFDTYSDNYNNIRDSARVAIVVSKDDDDQLIATTTLHLNGPHGHVGRAHEADVHAFNAELSLGGKICGTVNVWAASEDWINAETHHIASL